MNKVPGNDGKKCRKNYRCLTGNLPQADRAIFIKNKDGSLLFKDWLQDEKRPFNESGYLSPYKADSGNPYLTSTKDAQKNERRVIVAVHNQGYTVPANIQYKDENKFKCRLTGTKVSSDIVQWLGSVMKYERLCEAKDKKCQGGLNLKP